MSGVGRDIGSVQLEEMRQALSKIDQEMKQLRSIKEWALKQLGVDWEDGGAVELVKGFEDVGPGNGWYPYREAMATGARGVAGEPEFNSFYGYWYAPFILDREWAVGSVGEKEIRWWHGPVEDTPEGYEEPTEFDQEKYPEGRKHTFYVEIERMRAVQEPGDG